MWRQRLGPQVLTMLRAACRRRPAWPSRPRCCGENWIRVSSSPRGQPLTCMKSAHLAARQRRADRGLRRRVTGAGRTSAPRATRAAAAAWHGGRGDLHGAGSIPLHFCRRTVPACGKSPMQATVRVPRARPGGDSPFRAGRTRRDGQQLPRRRALANSGLANRHAVPWSRARKLGPTRVRLARARTPTGASRAPVVCSSTRRQAEISSASSVSTVSITWRTRRAEISMP